jgi:hypothetical protein
MKLDLTDGDTAEIMVKGATIYIVDDYRGYTRVVITTDDEHEMDGLPLIHQDGERVGASPRVHRIDMKVRSKVQFHVAKGSE